MLKENDKLLIIGDSVTDCGRREENTAWLGNGYVHILASVLYTKHPNLNISIVNKGISGDTSRSLKARWHEDVVKEAPDVLVILIGINDVWRHFDSDDLSKRVSLEDYSSNMQYMIESALSNAREVVVMSPFFLEADISKPMKIQTNQYIKALKEIVSRYDVQYIDLQEHFDECMKKYDYSQFTYKSDKIHPTIFGHYIIAKKLYELFNLC